LIAFYIRWAFYQIYFYIYKYSCIGRRYSLVGTFPIVKKYNKCYMQKYSNPLDICCSVKFYSLIILQLNKLKKCKFHNDQAYNRLRGWRLSASRGPIKGLHIKPSQILRQYGTWGFEGAYQLHPVVPRNQSCPHMGLAV